MQVKLARLDGADIDGGLVTVDHLAIRRQQVGHQSGLAGLHVEPGLAAAERAGERERNWNRSVRILDPQSEARIAARQCSLHLRSDINVDRLRADQHRLRENRGTVAIRCRRLIVAFARQHAHVDGRLRRNDLQELLECS